MKAWIIAARLRTLPLALSGILLGSAMAYLNGGLHLAVLLLGLLTAVLLQILSNFANDYGDFLKGTDQAANRKDRALASGKITVVQMRRALWFMVALSLISGLCLLYISLQKTDMLFVVFLLLGVAAIGAAIKYTAGKGAYGYYGFGDVFVLIFFGFVSVCGIYFLHMGRLDVEVWSGAAGLGLLATGVLNVNNIRDIFSDKESNKRTLPVRFRRGFALRYQNFLVWGGFLLILGAFLVHLNRTVAEANQLEYMLIFIAFGPFIFLFASHIQKVKKADPNDKMAFNKELKRLSLSTLLLVVFFWVLCFLYLG